MNLSEVRWEYEYIGTWPIPIKIILVMLLSGLLVGGWIYFDTQDQWVELENVEKKEQELRTTFETKQKKAVLLEEYRRQMQEIEKTFGDLLRQLPDKTQVPELLIDISQTGLATGLEFELFKPQPESSREFYAELPIDVRVVGTYMELASFISGIAQLPRIVTVHNLKITPRLKSNDAKSWNGELTVDTILKTYRYLDDTAAPKK